MDPFKALSSFAKISQQTCDSVDGVDEKVKAALEQIDCDKPQNKTPDDGTSAFEQLYQHDRHSELATCEAATDYMRKCTPRISWDGLYERFDMERYRIELEQRRLFTREHFRMAAYKVIDELTSRRNALGRRPSRTPQIAQTFDPYFRLLSNDMGTPQRKSSLVVRKRTKPMRDVFRKSVQMILLSKAARQRWKDPFSRIFYVAKTLLQHDSSNSQALEIVESRKSSEKRSSLAAALSPKVVAVPTTMKGSVDPFALVFNLRKDSCAVSANEAKAPELARDGANVESIDPFPAFYEFYKAACRRAGLYIGQTGAVRLINEYCNSAEYKNEVALLKRLWRHGKRPMPRRGTNDSLNSSMRSSTIKNFRQDRESSRRSSMLLPDWTETDEESYRSQAALSDLSSGTDRYEAVVTREKRTTYSRFPNISENNKSTSPIPDPTLRRHSHAPADKEEKATKMRQRKVKVTLLQPDNGGTGEMESETIEIIHTRTKTISKLELEEIIERLCKPLDRQVKSKAVLQLLREARRNTPRRMYKSESEVERIVTRLSEIPQWRRECSDWEPVIFEQALRQYSLKPSTQSRSPPTRRFMGSKLEGDAKSVFPPIDGFASHVDPAERRASKDHMLTVPPVAQIGLDIPEETAEEPNSKVLSWLTKPASVSVHAAGPWMRGGEPPQSEH